MAPTLGGSWPAAFGGSPGRFGLAGAGPAAAPRARRGAPRAMLFAVSYPPLEVPPVSEAPAFPSNFVETAQTLDRATIDALREAVALGRWPNGARLSKEQQGLCL
ncbi:MAG: DUF1315 family protein, partial [Gammaproteobacteria bacterium]|nr:DUF1315 family protein [Gammaproteobacteria bacterium]